MAARPARPHDHDVHPDYLRALVFGCEDGLVSTTGAIAGIAVGARDPEVVILSGIVVVLVEAFSMGAGQLLSERAVHQLEPSHSDDLLVGSALMIAAYLVGGAVPLVPVVVTQRLGAVWVGAALALVALFALGVLKAGVVHVGRVRSGVEIFAIGGITCVLGILAGVVFAL